MPRRRRRDESGPVEERHVVLFALDEELHLFSRCPTASRRARVRTNLETSSADRRRPLLKHDHRLARAEILSGAYGRGRHRSSEAGTALFPRVRHPLYLRRYSNKTKNPELTITFSHQHLCCITPQVIENMIKAHGSKDEIPGMRTAGMSQAFEVAERAGSYEEVQEAFANAAATAAPSTPS